MRAVSRRALAAGGRAALAPEGAGGAKCKPTPARLPPRAHELNPVELVWPHLKRSLANLAKRNITKLTALARTRLKRMQYRPAPSTASWPGPGSDPTPSCNPTLKDL